MLKLSENLFKPQIYVSLTEHIDFFYFANIYMALFMYIHKNVHFRGYCSEYRYIEVKILLNCLSQFWQALP